jgi:hypothetical protein
MDRQWWIFLAALVVAMIGGFNPGKRHDDKIDKLNDDSDNHFAVRDGRYEQRKCCLGDEH